MTSELRKCIFKKLAQTKLIKYQNIKYQNCFQEENISSKHTTEKDM